MLSHIRTGLNKPRLARLIVKIHQVCLLVDIGITALQKAFTGFRDGKILNSALFRILLLNILQRLNLLFNVSVHVADARVSSGFEMKAEAHINIGGLL